MTRKRQERKKKLAFLLQEMENLGEKRASFLKRRIGKKVRKGSPSLSRLEKGVKRLFRRISSPPLFLFRRHFQFKGGRKDFLKGKKYCQIRLAPSAQIKGETTRLESLRKRSLFKSQLVEKGRISLLYPKFFDKKMYSFFIKWRGVRRRKNSFGETLFFAQEGRADILLFRVRFFPSILCARQWVRHGRISLNGEKLLFPEYILSPGDTLAISPTFHRFFSPYSFNISNRPNTPPIETPIKSLPTDVAVTFVPYILNKMLAQDCHFHQRSVSRTWGEDTFFLSNDTLFPHLDSILHEKEKKEERGKFERWKKLKDEKWKKREERRGKFYFHRNYSWGDNTIPKGEKFLFSRLAPLWMQQKISYISYISKKCVTPITPITPEGCTGCTNISKRCNGCSNISEKCDGCDKCVEICEKKGSLLDRIPGSVINAERGKENFRKTLPNSQHLKSLLFLKKFLPLPLFFCREMKRFSRKKVLDKLRRELSFYLQFCGKKVWSLPTPKTQSSIIYEKWLKEMKLRPRKKSKSNLPQIKPAHVEVSYSSLRVIYLFNPQRTPFPTLVDLGVLERSFHLKG